MKETFSVILKMGDAWIHFENPSEIIAANKKEDVFPALQKLDGFIEDSKPIAGFISYEGSQYKIYLMALCPRNYRDLILTPSEAKVAGKSKRIAYVIRKSISPNEDTSLKSNPKNERHS